MEGEGETMVEGRGMTIGLELTMEETVIGRGEVVGGTQGMTEVVAMMEEEVEVEGEMR